MGTKAAWLLGNNNYAPRALLERRKSYHDESCLCITDSHGQTCADAAHTSPEQQSHQAFSLPMERSTFPISPPRHEFPHSVSFAVGFAAHAERLRRIAPSGDEKTLS
jgi:hypothetical protein